MSIKPYLEVVEEQGAPTNDGPVSASEVERYRGRLPDGLLEFWAKYGRGVWPGGRLQLCDPAIFEPVINEIFAGDPEFPPEKLTVFAMDTFGNLVLSDGSMRDLSIDVNFRHFTASEFADGPPRADLDYFLARTMLVFFGDTAGWSDRDGNDMFPEASARLGPVGEGEMYGFVPALAAGGDNAVENLKKVSAPEYHSFVNQMEPLKYFDYGFGRPGGPRLIRLIGRQQ